MKLISFLCLCLIIALSYNFFSIGGGDLPDVKSYYDGPLFTNQLDSPLTCSPSPPGVIRDDGTYENGYRSVSDGDSTTMVHKMVLGPGRTITQVCWAWTALPPSGSLVHNVVVYDTTGAGDSPGNLVGKITGVTSSNIAVFPATSRHSTPANIGPLPNRSYYIGVQWDNNPVIPYFSCADENGTFGGPGYQRVTSSYPPNWGLIMPVFTNWKNFSFRVELAPPVGIGGNNNQLPTQYSLKQNYPNPFNPSTTVEFELPKAGGVSLSVYDMLGRGILKVVDNIKYEAGVHEVIVDMNKFSSGVYFYKIEARDFRDTKKMMLIK